MMGIQNLRVLLRIQIGILLSFVTVKFFLRPLVLASESAQWINVFVLSYPNFCEAIIGSIAIVFILLRLKAWALMKDVNIKMKDVHLYLITILLAGVYVILQELKIHNLSGNNTYDPYDILFSVIGLLVIYFLFLRIQPHVSSV